PREHPGQAGGPAEDRARRGTRARRVHRAAGRHALGHRQAALRERPLRGVQLRSDPRRALQPGRPARRAETQAAPQAAVADFGALRLARTYPVETGAAEGGAMTRELTISTGGQGLHEITDQVRRLVAE